MNDILYDIQLKIRDKILFDYDMGNSTWFRAGGKAKGFIVINNLEDVKTIVGFADKIKYTIIGVGSNLLVRDSGYDGLIIKLGKNFNRIKIKKNFLSVGAGVLDLNLAKFALKNSIKDFEFFAGIPGTIGGAVIMNAGCYGAKTSDNLNRVLLLNANGEIKYKYLEELNLKYRSSTIGKNSIILQADFNFEYSSHEKILKKNKYVKSKRKETQPIKEKTSGSTFKNPKSGFAAELIEKAGCKGMKVGDASVSYMHSNFIINNGTATASDIENLAEKVKNRVKEVHGVELEWEIKILGE